MKARRAGSSPCPASAASSVAGLLRKQVRRAQRPHYCPRPARAGAACRDGDRPAGAARGQYLWRDLSVRAPVPSRYAALAPRLAGVGPERRQVERCFQNPRPARSVEVAGGARARPTVRPPLQPGKLRPASDYATVLNSPEADRKKIQESLRTLDKYNGPIDGNLQSEATTKAIADWQKGPRHGSRRQADATGSRAAECRSSRARRSGASIPRRRRHRAVHADAAAAVNAIQCRCS